MNAGVWDFGEWRSFPGMTLAHALEQTTHLGVGAHPDDLEIMAWSGIDKCFRDETSGFGGVTVCDGAGCVRSGPYSRVTEEEMVAIRKEEQWEAALLGEYLFQCQLGLPSKALRDPAMRSRLVDCLAGIIGACPVQDLYLHNPCDKHSTHVALVRLCLEAVRRLPSVRRPVRVYGCEVWRDLDWVPDSMKLALPCDRHPELGIQLVDVFRSQIEGGKNYASAVAGRRMAHATFHNPREGDGPRALVYAMDLTPVIQDGGPSLEEWVDQHLIAFCQSVTKTLTDSGLHEPNEH